MNWIAKSENDLPAIAKEIISSATNKTIIFQGEMGAGKTTLIGKLCAELNVLDKTSSPTFSIVNQYLTEENETVFHFDFYRIENEQEVMDMGYEDYFYSDAYCFIEWAEKIPNLLPEEYTLLKIELTENNNRIISIVSQ